LTTVDRRLKELRGAPRLAYLRKWEKWLKEIYGEKYGDTVGEGLEAVERHLLEYCSGLEDSECFQELYARSTGRATRLEDVYLEHICRWQQSLASELGVSDAQSALKEYLSTDDPERVSALEEYLKARFQCIYNMPIELRDELITRLPVRWDWIPSLEAGAEFCELRGYTMGRFKDVWDVSPLRRKYTLLVVRQPRPCIIFHNIEEGILWVASCSYVLVNDAKRMCVAYKFD